MRNLMLQAGVRSCVWTISILVLFGTAKPLHATDFLIVEKIEQLSIYNKYQQEASRRERQLFAPFAPIKILKANDVLGDGFTYCMQVENEGQIFYLLREKDGGLSQSGALGHETIFTNAIILLDTVQILTERSLLLSPINSQARHLSSRDLLVRIFRHQSLTYCRTLSAPPVFGWVDFNGKTEGVIWSALQHRTSPGTSITPLVSQKILKRVEEVNRVLARLFLFFNSRTNQQKQTPAWTMEASSNVITCTLGGTASAEQFQQSTFYLVNEIENIALGSEFQVTRSPGRIEIRHK